MSYNTLQQLIHQCNYLGIRTLGQLANVRQRYLIKTNNELVNFINAAYVYDIPLNTAPAQEGSL